MSKPLNSPAAVRSAVIKAVDETVITDIHTHLFPPSHGKLLLWGVDELLTYHYLVAELFMAPPPNLTPAAFFKLPKRRQADLVWERLFLNCGPISEARRGVLTVLNSLGLDVAGRRLDSIRSWFDARKIEDYLPTVFELAGVNYAIMTNNPFNAEEVEHWQARRPVPERLKAALRIDTLVLDWPTAAKAMRTAGYKTPASPTRAGFAAARKFLADWARRIKPAYMAASLGSDFAYPSRADATGTKVLDNVVLPVARELNLPVAMMIGVRRRVNPALGDGGDGGGPADVTAVQTLCQRNPDVKFMATMLSRNNQHELCVLARKFANLHVFGCWWFCNNPSIIEEMTRMRLELMGTAVTLQHSDARVLDQLIYKWRHTRTIVGKVLADKYTDAFDAGWRPTADEIARDARELLGGRFESFTAGVVV